MMFDWGALHEDILVIIFTYLPRRDRLACSLVCLQWRGAMYMPSLWRSMKMTLDVDMMEPSTIMLTRMFSPYIREIELASSKSQHILWKWMQNNSNTFVKRVCRYLTLLRQTSCQVHSFKLFVWCKFSRIRKLNYHLSLFLKSQKNLCEISFHDNQLYEEQLISLLTSCRDCSHSIESLDLRNSFVWWNDTYKSDLTNCLSVFENLTNLKIDFYAFNLRIEEVLLRNKYKNLRYLEILVSNGNELDSLIDQDWTMITDHFKLLKVALDLQNIIYVNHANLALHKSIPLQSFTLTTAKTWNNDHNYHCQFLFKLLAEFYHETLEVLNLTFYDNMDVAGDMLLNIAKKCKQLKLFNFNGIVNGIETLTNICKQNVEVNGFNNINLSIKNMNFENLDSVMKLYKKISNYRKTHNIKFSTYKINYKDMLYFYP